MFIVTLENGENLVEGKDIKFWKEIPRDKKIAAVTLTAGGNVMKTLSGYDKYVVVYDGVAILHHSDSPSGTKGETTSQTCYAIKNHKTWKRKVGKILKMFELELHSATSSMESSCKQLLIQSAKKKLRKNENKLLEELSNSEVDCVSIGINKQSFNRAKIDIKEEEFREGIVGSDVLPSEDKIKETLLSI
jgi:hypothetical protein